MSKALSSQFDDGARKKPEYVFRPEEEQHVIELNYSWKYVDTIEVHDNRLVEVADMDGYPAEDLEFHCRCGKEFSSKEEAEAHLRRRAVGTIPYPFLPRPIRWKDEVTSICDGRVHCILNHSNLMGRLVKGSNYLTATARTILTPPEQYQFETWEPLVNGRLTRPDGSVLFDPYHLKLALGYLSEAAHYQPERYLIHFRGEAPLFIEGNGRAILIAPRVRRRDRQTKRFGRR